MIILRVILVAACAAVLLAWPVAADEPSAPTAAEQGAAAAPLPLPLPPPLPPGKTTVAAVSG
jgi:hypothetical protein